MGCVSDGNPCIIGICDEVSDFCLPTSCPAPEADPGGGRTIDIVPAPGTAPLALRISGHPTDVAVACQARYVQPDGSLDTNAVFQTPAQWGSIVVRGELIRPGTTLRVQK